MGNNFNKINQAITIITSMQGTAKNIHLANEIGTCISARAFTTIALGGVPIGVPIPPIFAPIGIAKAKAIRPLSSLSKIASTGAKIASIIAAVAVLLINIEKMAVTSIKPKRTK